MGGKVCKAASRRDSAVEDVRVVPQPQLQARRSALPIAERETLHWLNDLMAGLWPKVNEAVTKIAHESIEPSIQASMPTGFKSTHFKKFTLGAVSPKFGPISVMMHGDSCLKMVCGVDYQSDVDIEIATHVGSVGVKSIHLKGDLMIHLAPLIEESPVVGGICVYFLDQPDVGLDFTGIGKIAGCPGIAGTIQSVINSTIAGMCVLPNTIAVPLGTPEQGVDPALLKLPEPIGILRFRPVRAKHLLGMDMHLMRARTSDPFIKVKVADDEWTSSVVKSNLNPEWSEEDVHDFVVFDRDQKVWIEVWDENTITAHHLIGKAEAYKVGEILGLGSQPLPLTSCQRGKKTAAGSLDLKLEWLEFTKAEAKDERCVIAVKIESIVLPAGMDAVALKPAIQGQFRGVTKVSPAGVMPTAPTLPAVTKALQDVAKRCKSKGMDDQAIAKILDVAPEDVPAMLDDEVDKKTKEDGVSKTAKQILHVDSVLYLSTAKVGLESEELTLLVVDKKRDELGRATVKMGDVLSAKGMAKPGPVFFSLADSLKLEGQQIEADIQVSVLGLQSAPAAEPSKASSDMPSGSGEAPSEILQDMPSGSGEAPVVSN
eukprot:TRINITY_DN58180_c0_g1_i1.p1 TRINITY_DN58180_c0_g1~~TRINITY_DN58180_c0_g1_i1.p1  ORF type:complete len:599 (-),score=128.40 TRINITY_DN58180_c0_g1_i1:473-2269(-)